MGYRLKLKANRRQLTNEAGVENACILCLARRKKTNVKPRVEISTLNLYRARRLTRYESVGCDDGRFIFPKEFLQPTK